MKRFKQETNIPLYYIGLSLVQLYNLLDWQKAQYREFKRKGVKEPYLSIHREDPLAEFIQSAIDAIEKTFSKRRQNLYKAHKDIRDNF